MKRLVYIAGPYTAPDAYQIELNVREAERYAYQVWKMGGVPVAPHLMNRFFMGALPDEVVYKGTEALMLRCDAVLLLPKWPTSRGASQEKVVALEEGLPVYWVESHSELYRTGAGGLIELHRWLLDLKPGEKLPGYP